MENKSISDLLFSENKSLQEIHKASRFFQCFYIERACQSLIKELNENEQLWNNGIDYHVTVAREEDDYHSYFGLALSNEYKHNDEKKIENDIETMDDIFDMACNTDESFKKFLTLYVEDKHYNNLFTHNIDLLVLNQKNYSKEINQLKENLINSIEPEYLLQKQKYCLKNDVDNKSTNHQGKTKKQKPRL